MVFYVSHISALISNLSLNKLGSLFVALFFLVPLVLSRTLFIGTWLVWERNQVGSTCCSPVQLHILLIQFLELHLVFHKFHFLLMLFQLWHVRFGHPSHAKLSLLNKLVPDVHVNKSHCCDVCHFSKQKSLSFPLKYECFFISFWTHTCWSMGSFFCSHCWRF